MGFITTGRKGLFSLLDKQVCHPDKYQDDKAVLHP